MKKQKKQTPAAAPPLPAPHKAKSAPPLYHMLEGPGPDCKPTLKIIGLGWAALAICGLLWRLWTGSGTIIFLCFLLLGGGFTLAAIFDHFLRRGRRGRV